MHHAAGPADQPRLTALASGRILWQIEPTNRGTTFAVLDGPLTRPGLHCVRSHFAVSVIEAGSFALRLGGHVSGRLSLSLTLDDLRAWSGECEFASNVGACADFRPRRAATMR